MSSDALNNCTSSEAKTSTPTDEVSNQNNEISDSSSDSHSTDSDGSEHSLDLTFDWFEEQLRTGVDLRPTLSRILPGLPDDIPQSAIYEIFMQLLLPFHRRTPLEQYKTLNDAVELIRTRQNILILTGAGISVSCGSKQFNIFSYLSKSYIFFFSS